LFKIRTCHIIVSFDHVPPLCYEWSGTGRGESIEFNSYDDIAALCDNGATAL